MFTSLVQLGWTFAPGRTSLTCTVRNLLLFDVKQSQQFLLNKGQYENMTCSGDLSRFKPFPNLDPLS